MIRPLMLIRALNRSCGWLFASMTSCWLHMVHCPSLTAMAAVHLTTQPACRWLPCLRS